MTEIRNEPIETRLFKENINLLRKLAWSFHRTTGVEWDELFSEACLSFILSLRSYKPKKGKLSTHVQTCITNHLIDFTRRYHDITPASNILDDETFRHSEGETDTSFLDTLHSLSEEAQYVCNVILSNPEEFLEESKRLARKHVVDRLRKEGWSWPKIWRSFREIKSALKA